MSLRKIYVTADTHFGDGHILEYCNRPFPTIRTHDEYLISKINEYVLDTDILYVLGDFGDYEHRKRINCETVHLIYGNHDSRLNTDKVFTSAYENFMYQTLSNIVYMSHYPHAYWPASHRGSIHIYGHVHDAREEGLDEIWPTRKAMDIGVDSAKRLLGDYIPFDLDFIESRFSSVPGHDDLEFYDQHQEHRKIYQVTNSGEVVQENPSLKTRPALRQEVFEWARNR